MAKLKITLTRSTNSVVKNQKATVQALGVKKLGSTVERDDTPQVRGMIKVVAHLVKVEEI